MVFTIHSFEQQALETGLLQDDKLAILAQLFWIAVCLLESDYEHEFLLALRLLERVLHRLPLDRPDCRDRVLFVRSFTFKNFVFTINITGGEDVTSTQVE